MAGCLEQVLREKGEIAWIGLNDLKQLLAMMSNREDLSKNSLG
jgi:hypothetical protein